MSVTLRLSSENLFALEQEHLEREKTRHDRHGVLGISNRNSNMMVSFADLQVRVPLSFQDGTLADQPEALKEWIWKSYGHQIMDSMSIHMPTGMNGHAVTPVIEQQPEDQFSLNHSVASYTNDDSMSTLESSLQQAIREPLLVEDIQFPIGHAVLHHEYNNSNTTTKPERKASLCTSDGCPTAETQSLTCASNNYNKDDSEGTTQEVESPPTQDRIQTLQQQVKDRTKKLQQANALLARANRTVVKESQKQLEHFACMSHEIRTPLNCILGMSSLMVDEEQDESNLTALQKESLHLIVKSGELLLTVVNDVLDYAKYEAGKMDVTLGPCHLQDTLESIYRPVCTKAFQEHGVIVRCFFDANVPTLVHTDERRLQQILFNLLGNAVKFSKAGGLVEFHVKVCPVAVTDATYCSAACEEANVQTPASNMQQALLETTPNDERMEFFGRKPPEEVHLQQAGLTDTVLRFVVKDYGKGIKECDFQRIFQPFLQASDGKENTYGGTGLGLPITGKLVRGLNGNIYVDSVENEWTAFTVDLPFCDTLPDNHEAVAKKMTNATVYFVFNDYFPGTVAYVTRLCHLYNVQVEAFHDFEAMDAHVASTAFDPTQTYICFGYEGQYNAETYQRLAQKAKHSTLVTFGPRRAVPAADHHYGCPMSVVPAHLMDALSSFVPEESVASTSLPAKDAVASSQFPFELLRVLVAEDNIVNQKVLLRMLHRIGIQHVDMVDNGQKAVDQEAAKEYDLVLLDMQMPVMDGLEACTLIKQRYDNVKMDDSTTSNPGPKLAFVTAHVSDSFRQETLEAGASGYLAKPFTLSGIQKFLDELYA